MPGPQGMIVHRLVQRRVECASLPFPYDDAVEAEPIEPAANDRPTPTPGVSPFLSSLPHFLPPGGGLWPRPAIGWAHEVGSVAAHQCTRSAPEINAGRTLTGSAPLEAEALASGAMPLPLG